MTDPHITKLQDLFQIGEANSVSLRAISRYGWNLPTMNENFTAAYYPAVEDRWSAAMSRARALNACGYSVYTPLNPVRPEFAEGAVSDVDIITRRLLLVDLDRADTRPDGPPASDDEIRAAFDVADRIEEGLRNFAAFRDASDARPTRVMSGNGVHLLYRLPDLPNDRETRDVVALFLKALASRFNDSSIKVDTTVSNASRITKLPGTVAWKAYEETNRPFREACFV
jgi:hypothetical protein